MMPTLRLGSDVLLILSNDTIEGRIVGYRADVESGAEITVELFRRRRFPTGLPVDEPT